MNPITLSDRDTRRYDIVELRGYVGIPLIGRTTRWFRVGAEPETCREVS